jgi:hypothetical protein
MPILSGPLPANVLDALQRGNVVLEAIRLLREATRLRLKEAKEVIDEHLRGNPVPHSRCRFDRPTSLLRGAHGIIPIDPHQGVHQL